jgi:peptidoglycan/xylan/chitin deacetylase (PgdA/CDA1 family)
MAGQSLLRASLDILHYSGASHVLRGAFGGVGAILMLHHVRPQAGPARAFAPNAVLDVTPDFLDGALALATRRGFELVSMDEAAGRLASGRPVRPFLAVTLDDGYRDNLVYALPVFRRHRCPFTVYIAPAITDGVAELWWDGLEQVIARSARIEGEIGGQTFALDTATDDQRDAAWRRLYWPVRNLPQHAQRRWIRGFCGRHGFDLDAWCRSEAMSWDEVRQIAADPLCTIGAHTINHYAVSQLEAADALGEMRASADRIAAELGARPRHLAFPYGDEGSAASRDFRLAAEAGFTTAVTTRKGMLFPAHSEHMTALPRLSLSGEFQKLRYVDALLTGTPFALFNRFRRLSVA